MPSILDQPLNKLKPFWQKTSISQRVFIAGLTLAVIVAFFLMIFWLNRPNYKVLYSKLTPEDAAKIVQTLQAAKETYQLTDNGTTILVPEQKVYDLRLKVAGEGGLVGQGVGLEIFDEIRVGQTDFVQKINYQRALQGELARTINEFPAVEKTRVHLVIPRKSLFIEEQSEPSASIVLTMVKGKELGKDEVNSIVNLTAMAVEGLNKDRITVTDTSGKSIYTPKDEASLDGMTSTQLEYKLTLQRNLEKRIEQMLFPVIGPGRVIAKVNADLDFSRKSIEKELFDPDSAVVRSEQRSEESTQGRANAETGVPEANFRGDGIAGALSSQQTSRETRTTNFEINKETQSIVTPLGLVDRMTVAVIVDGTYEKNPDTGEYAFTPRSEEEVNRIKQLVQNAVGYESARGDSIEITSISFGGPDLEPEPSLIRTITDYALRLGKPLLNALLIFLFLLMVVRPVILALIRPRVEGEMIEGLEGLPAGEERLALIEADEEEADAIDALKKIEDIKAHAMQISEQNMDQAVAILRNWIKQNEGVRVG